MRLALSLAVFSLGLASCQFTDEPYHVPFDEALDAVARAAERGDTDAAVTYETIRYREAPSPGGLNRLQGYALLGQTRAAHAVAEAYMHGWGVAVDYEEATRWLRHAADSGDDRALRMLATYEAHSTASRG